MAVNAHNLGDGPNGVWDEWVPVDGAEAMRSMVFHIELQRMTEKRMEVVLT